MKRKIGIIIALILAVVGVAALKSETAGALGAGRDAKYCTINANSKSEAKECAIVLKYYHANDSYDGVKEFCGADIEAGEVVSNCDADSAKSNMIKHFADGYAVQYGKVDKWVFAEWVRSYYVQDDLFSSVGITAPTTVAQCWKVPESEREKCGKGLPNAASKYKVGMAFPPICYTDNYKARSECNSRSGGNSGDNSGNNGSENNEDNPSGPLDTTIPGSNNCSTLFPSSWCQADGIGKVLEFIVAVLTGTVVIAGTVGIVICAVLILTARDNEQQLATGKKRLMQVVIGMVAWIMFSVLANLLIPKTTTKIDTEVSNTSIMAENGENEV